MKSSSLLPLLLLAACTTTADSIDPAPIDPTIDPAAPDPVPGATVDLESRLLHRIELAPGHVVSFYEPDADTVGTIETFDPAIHTPVTERWLDPGAIYVALRPGEAPPSALRDALVRAATRAIEPAAASAGSGTGGGAPSRLRTSSNADSYISNGGCDTVFVASQPIYWSMCRINWSGGFWASDGGAKVIHGHLRAVQGTVMGRVQVGTAIFDRTVTAGTTAIYVFGNNTAGLRRLDVLNAENDFFHVSAKFRNCTSSCTASNTWH